MIKYFYKIRLLQYNQAIQSFENPLSLYLILASIAASKLILSVFFVLEKVKQDQNNNKACMRYHSVIPLVLLSFAS